MTTAIAYLCPRRQVRVIDANGNDRAQTGTADAFIGWGSWANQREKTKVHSWPTWSPDSQQLACFRMSKEDPNPRVLTWDIDNICAEELAILNRRLPIYLQWCHDNRQIGLVAQRRDRLFLSTVCRGEVGTENNLVDGSPMFFTWANDKLAVYVGNGDQPRLTLIDPRQPDLATDLPWIPGNFCAPLWLGDRVVYVAHHHNKQPTIVMAEPAGSFVELEEVQGLIAMSTSRDKTKIARATSKSADGSLYHDLSLLDVATGQVHPLMEDGCLAFLWAGDALVAAMLDARQNLLRWFYLEQGEKPRHLIDLAPTRDVGFYLRFFEQYCQSHLLIDAKAEHLLLAGMKTGNEDPRIWRVPLHGGPAEDIAAGVFAVFAPHG
ncbi:MAG: hypothetical protein HN348_04200 [Proteobacteria bacterium]|nr:hypothetical protein [Pseudomonadota bacterium]